MTSALLKAWNEVVRPIIFRPKRIQVAALCYRKSKNGRDVLLITSRGTGRWILPKGWPIEGKDGAGSALQEAWEEAGVARARIRPRPLGTFQYKKEMDNGAVTPVETEVYLAEVQEMSPAYPEVAERTRKWVSPNEAANMVAEPGLKDILRDL